MTKAIKLVAFGNSTGAIFPKDMLARLRVDKGDMLYVTEAADGSFRLTPYDPEFQIQMDAAERLMREDRDILHALAQ